MIGVYVHNRGRGHLNRVLPVVAALRDSGEEVTMLLAGPFDERTRPSGSSVVHLPATREEVGPDPDDIDLSARRAAVTWIDRMRPRTVWVDGPPAMSLAARMTGTPVVSTLPPGLRDDEPHVLRCRAAETLLAAWPPGVHPATVAGTRGRVCEVGGISRFERRHRKQPLCRRRPRVVHLNSAGPSGDHRFWRAVRSTARRLGVAEWVEVGGPDGVWREDPWDELTSADVVVTCAGQTSVADAACSDVPMVVVPRRHEYGEQDATAGALGAFDGAAVLRYGDGPTAVAHAVCDQVARSRDQASGGIRHSWGVDGAASRAAEIIRSTTTTTTRTAVTR